MAGAEIIQHGDAVAGLQQGGDAMAADITGAARNQ
jgi:hypothetical protein